MGNDEFDDVDVGCFGSKMLLAGDDKTVHNFLQEYVSSLLKLESAKNLTLRKNTQVYLVPSGQNSLSSYIAAREPLYL